MLDNLKLKAKFTVVISLILLISLPIITFITYRLLRENAIREIYTQSELLLSMMEASRNYVVKYTTPIFEREVPGKFVVEGMADSFVNFELQNEIGKTHKNYSYKVATLNPLNLRNKADAFESDQIKAFRDRVYDKEWRGFIEKENGDFYVIMKPISVKDMGCLSCHGDPDLAPDEVATRYGKQNGYNWKVGDTVAVDAIYVPAEVPIRNAQKAMGVFLLAYIIFFAVLILVINLFIARKIVAPIERFVDSAEAISKGNLDREFMIEGDDEMKKLSDAFVRMKVSIVKLMKIIHQR